MGHFIGDYMKLVKVHNILLLEYGVGRSRGIFNYSIHNEGVCVILIE
jgi:hypothetical protein